ncbi:MAG TPA: sensor histidine kinase [Anaerolineales bacterium]|nr:sensor histidine kinase [Anaerolineales bacterium]
MQFSSIIIYFIYGLAFFSMGLLVIMEGGRSSDERVRKALRPLAGFGLVHGVHEWLEMFVLIANLSAQPVSPYITRVQISLLSFSFLSLAAFGGYLLAKDEVAQRISLIVPLGLEAIWVVGLLAIKADYPAAGVPDATQVWTRYILGIPSSLLAAVGLIAQQRAFRRAGLVRFGQDSLWAAVAFAWYGLVGQSFTNVSALPPSNLINEVLFQQLFGFPIQIVRAVAASAAAIFVIRFLRAFQVETEQKIATLKAQQLEESRQREALRAELFRRVVAAQEAERQRMARDLHDETGQALTAIGLGLRGLESRLARDPAQATTTLHELQTLTSDSLQELQRLMTDLRPSHLDDLGLSAALRWYVGKLQERSSFNIRVDIAGNEQPIDEAVKIAIFRIVQESLNNVIKHSKANHVKIDLAFEETQIRVRVFDDGEGFNLDRLRVMQSSSRPSLGLAGMQERAALLGGTVSIQSGPRQGTLVEVVIPYHDGSEEQDGHTSVAGG